MTKQYEFTNLLLLKSKTVTQMQKPPSGEALLSMLAFAISNLEVLIHKMASYKRTPFLNVIQNKKNIYESLSNCH